MSEIWHIIKKTVVIALRVFLHLRTCEDRKNTVNSKQKKSKIEEESSEE